MLFITTWTVPPENRDKAIARFKESGGPPPVGVRMIGRWHAADLSSGLGVSEASDVQGLAKWALDWSDRTHRLVRPQTMQYANEPAGAGAASADASAPTVPARGATGEV